MITDELVSKLQHSDALQRLYWARLMRCRLFLR